MEDSNANKKKTKKCLFVFKNNTKSLGGQVDKKMRFAKGCLKSGKSINKIPKNQAKNEVTSLK